MSLEKTFPKSLQDLEAGQVFFLHQMPYTLPFVLLLEDRECKESLGFRPSSLPVAEIEKVNDCYHFKRNGLVLDVEATVYVNGDRLDRRIVGQKFSMMRASYIKHLGNCNY